MYVLVLAAWGWGLHGIVHVLHAPPTLQTRFSASRNKYSLVGLGQGVPRRRVTLRGGLKEPDVSKRLDAMRRELGESMQASG
jgi:hypothetical protein